MYPFLSFAQLLSERGWTRITAHEYVKVLLRAQGVSQLMYMKTENGGQEGGHRAYTVACVKAIW